MILTSFTTEQLVDRWEARRRIQNIMGIFSQHILLKIDRDLFADLWHRYYKLFPAGYAGH